MGAANKLTAAEVRTLRNPGRYNDGLGLYLQVSRWGTKAWIFRYKRDGKSREMGLGSITTFSLKEARERAHEARQLLQDGKDPIHEKKQVRAQRRQDEAKRHNFEYCAERYIQAHEGDWRNSKHHDQWRSTLRTYAYPVFKDVPVSDIDQDLVLKVVEPIWNEKRETASRLRQRIENVLDMAKVRGWRAGENPARWKGHLDKILPARRKKDVRPQPALPWQQIPEFMTELRLRTGVSALALEFAILTAARTGAVIGAEWSEIDLKERVWTVPPTRVGTKIDGEDPQPRKVPLTPRVVEILKAVPREKDNQHVFIGIRRGGHLSNMAMLELLKDMNAERNRRGLPGWNDPRRGKASIVTHGFRSTFKDWCAEATNFPNEVSEAALWHVVADKVEAAYRRGDLFEKRRALMSAWTKYCEKPPATKDNVVSMHRMPA